MPKAERKDIWFDSADGKSRVAGYFYTGGQPPFCVVQVSHGMCEYIHRYGDFADFLAENGVALCGNDHIGHGHSAKEEDYGHFTEKGGRRFALLDLKEMNRRAREAFPGRPLILLGHSMGSFFARQYAADWPETIDGLIISGTGGPNPLVSVGIGLSSLVGKIKGDRHRSQLVQNLAFGSYLSRIENPKSIYDWVSRDEEIVRNYEKDPMCNYRFTTNGFGELFSALRDVSSPEWAGNIDKKEPVLMISGDADPVGGYGKGVDTVRGWLEAAGVENLTAILYPGARHEVLNEVNRQDVYRDVLDWLYRWWGPQGALPGGGQAGDSTVIT